MQLDSLHLVYFSPTRTSLAIGEAIACGTGFSHIVKTDLTYGIPDHPVNIKNALTVIVVPVYGGRVAETAMERLKWISGEDSLVVPVVVYGNRDYEDALLELKDWCSAHGFAPVAGAAFIGEHSFSRPGRPIAGGRPDSEDLEVANDFGQQVAQYLFRIDSSGKTPSLNVKGNYPYKVKGGNTPQAPVTSVRLCSECGLCVDICPVGAIEKVAGMPSDAGLCIKCCACVKQCSQGARVFDTPYTNMLFKNFSARKKPELFVIEDLML